MPKSKRDKKISLTKTSKKGLALKQTIVEDVRKCVEQYNSIYVFTYENMRNEKMKEVRQEWKSSRFFFGKNKVMAIGLGRSKEDEVEDDLHKISECLTGQCALLFTDRSKKKVLKWFEHYSCEGFARSGDKVNKTIKLKEGPLDQFSHAIEPYLRQLGLPTKLERGIVTLIKDYVVCKKGDVLKPEQAKILELLGHKLAVFKLILKAVWMKGEGFEKIDKNDDEKDNDDDNEEDVEMDDN